MRAAAPLLALAVAAAACLSCRGTHTRPPGFVKASVVEGYATLVVRVEDGAWVQSGELARAEMLRPAGEAAALFLGAAGEGAAAGGEEARAALLAAWGFERTEDGGAATTLLRLADLVRDVASAARTIGDEEADRAAAAAIAGGEGEGALAGVELPSGPDGAWFMGWFPRGEPLYVIVVYGTAPGAKAQEITALLGY